MTSPNTIIADLADENHRLLRQISELEVEVVHYKHFAKFHQSQLDAIRAQEPVAWRFKTAKWLGGNNYEHQWSVSINPRPCAEPLYTHAPDSAARIAELEHERDAVLAELALEKFNLRHHLHSAKDKIATLKSALREAVEMLYFALDIIGHPDDEGVKMMVKAIDLGNAALGEE